MSQKVKEFVRQSGIEVQTPNSTSNENNNFAKNLEMSMQEFPKNNLVTNAKYGSFAQFIDSNSDNNLNNEFSDVMKLLSENNNTTLLTPPVLEVSKLNPGMFNATVNKDFGKQQRLDVNTILMKSPVGKTYVGEGLYIDTVEIKGLYGQFKTGFSHTRVSGPRGGLDKNFFSAQLMLQVTNNTETKGATVNFYRNGKIRFSGGFIGVNIARQPELIRRYIVDTYTNKQSFLYNPFEYNNLSGQFRINGVFKSLTTITSNARKYGMTNVSYEPEITPFLYAYFGDTKFIMATSGNVQISGAKSPADMLNAYTIGQRFMERLDADGQIVITGVFEEGVKKTSKPRPVVKPKAKTQTNMVAIEGKKCERLKKPELMNLARRMGVVDFRTKVKNGSRASTKREICDRIRGKTVVPTFKNTITNGTNKTVKNTTMTGVNKTFKVGKILCINLKKGELIRIATVLKIPIDGKETKTILCKKIQAVRNRLAAPKPKTPPPPPKANMKRVEVMKKRGLDDTSIRKDISRLYGSAWMKRYNPSLNDDVNTMKKALAVINRGDKMGIPFKKDVDYIKKKVVNRWKFDRKANLEKKYLSNTINVSGINANKRNAYRRAAIDYVMSQKGPVSNKKLVAYKKSWLKFMKNV